jgi:uncharacterized membrane protein YgaE (UPF0421/DUF939 family)
MKTSASFSAIHGKITWTPVLLHSARTAVAAIASLLIARCCRLPETYWAPITTLVVTQSSLRETASISGERFIGTALGSIAGVIVASRYGSSFIMFGISVFILGLLTSAPHLGRSAYRFAGITLAIVMLVPSTDSPRRIALHRFVEVCIGIGVALVLTVFWPEREEPHINTRGLTA